MEIQPFLLITSKDIIMLDAGLGFEDADSDTMQLFSNLQKLGISPHDVTKVLMSHLHKDHAGGVSFTRQHETLSFPNATYYLQKRELEFAQKTGFPSFMPEELHALSSSANVKFLEDDSGTIDGYIRYELTGAHSPFHQVFWIHDENETVFFGGDDAPQLQQMKIRYKTKYDFNPEKAMQLREAWWEQGNKENWIFLFYHDIKTPTYTARNNNHSHVEA